MNIPREQEDVGPADPLRLRSVLDRLEACVYAKDGERRYLYVNDHVVALYGRPREQILGQTDEALHDAPIAAALRDNDRQVIEQGQTLRCEERLVAAGEDEVRCYWSVKQPLVNAAGQVVGLSGISTDITSRKRMEEALRAQQSLLQAVVDNTPVEYWARDIDRRCILANSRAVAHWGPLVGKRIEDIDADDQDKARSIQRHQRAYGGEVVDEEVQYPFEGRLRTYQTVIAPVRVDGKIVGIVGFNQDITERKVAADRIHHLAYYDALTGLPNRRLMFDRLGHALAGSVRRQRQGALLLIDLDNFKVLNDTQGHDAGDKLLVAVAARLSAGIRQCDTAARLGGDEFVVILEDIDGRGPGALQAEQLAMQLHARLREPYDLDLGGRRLSYHCNSSIGIALFGAQGDAAGDAPAPNAEELLRRADTAMYQAKAAGRGTLRFFDPRMQAAVAARAGLEADLRRAIEERQFVLHYQPQLSAAGQVIGAEVLVRWLHPERGLVSPAEFIPLAEESGLIVPLGDWVLETACHQLAAWASQPGRAGLSLAVNVSARQFHQPTLVEWLRTLMHRTGVPPSRLKLELTESLLLDQAEEVISRMLELKAMGVGFALDDFGTGYSSLTYLKRLPLDQLKIDQSFVRDVLTDPNDAAIARTILALGNILGLAVIAEGVETDAQLQFLAGNGCHAYQGYLFGRPLPLADFEALLVARAAQ